MNYLRGRRLNRRTSTSRCRSGSVFLKILAWFLQGCNHNEPQESCAHSKTRPEHQLSNAKSATLQFEYCSSFVTTSKSRKMNRGGGGGGRKVLLPPINFIFKLLQQHSTVQIWLYEQLAIRIEGRIRVSCLSPTTCWLYADDSGSRVSTNL